MKKISNFMRIAALCGSLMAAPWAAALPIVVGQVGPLSGLDGTQGRTYAAGMQLYFNQVNKYGGVNGHTFVLVSKDDRGFPETTVSKTKQMLLEDSPTVLGGYFGNRNIAELVASGVLEKEQIALVGYRTTDVRAETPLLYSIRAGVRDEIAKLIEHLVTVGITRLGFVYEDGPGGAGLMAAAEEAAKKSHAQIVVSATYPEGTTRVAPAIATMLTAKPQTVLLITSGAAAAGFIEQYRSEGGAAQLFAHSGADIEQLSKRLGEDHMKGVAIAQVTPSPYKITNRLTKDFADTVAKAKDLNVPVSYAMMEGYINAKVIVEAVRRLGARPTRQGIAATLDTMSAFDMGGYNVSFKPGMRAGSKFVELSIITVDGKIRQ